MSAMNLNGFSLVRLIAIVVALARAPSTSADDRTDTSGPEPDGKPLSAFSCVLAGSDTQFVYELTHVDAARIRVDWTLLVDRQSIGRGVVVPDVVNAKGARTIAIPLTIPSVRPG